MQAHGKNKKEGEPIPQGEENPFDSGRQHQAALHDEENPFERESNHDEGASPEVVELDTANAQIKKDKDAITAWQIVTSLCPIIFSEQNRPGIINATVLTIISVMLNFAGPYLLEKSIDSFGQDEDEYDTLAGLELNPVNLILMLSTAYLFAQVVPSIRDRMLAPVQANTTRDMMNQLAEHQLTKSLDYHNKTQFEDQVNLIQRSFISATLASPLLTQVAPTLCEMIMAVTVLSSRFGPGMGFGLAGVSTILVGYSALTTKPVIDARVKGLKLGNEAFLTITNAMAQFKNIYDFGKVDQALNKIKVATQDAATAEIKVTTLPLDIGLGHIAIPRLGMLAASLYVAVGIGAKQYTVQDFIFLVGYLQQLSASIPAVGSALNSLFSKYPDIKYVFNELIKAPEFIDRHPDKSIQLSEQPPNIRFENVTFAYPAKEGETPKLICDNLSFEVKSGESVALVSRSGGGKSTIFKLLYGYNVPLSGKIYINDQDISQVSLKSVQKILGSIAQQPNLASGSIRDNILFGLPDVGYDILLMSEAQFKEKKHNPNQPILIRMSDDNYKLWGYKAGKWQLTEVENFMLPKELENKSKAHISPDSDLYQRLKKAGHAPTTDEVILEVARKLKLDEFLQSKGLDTEVGQGGNQLSGGENQRVALIRGLLKTTARIWLADEPSSALDKITEDRVIRALFLDILKDQTSLLITHNMQLTQLVDKVLVLDQGKLVAEGKPHDLMQQPGLYRDLCNEQNKEEASLLVHKKKEKQDEAAHSSSACPDKQKLPSVALLAKSMSSVIGNSQSPEIQPRDKPHVVKTSTANKKS